MLVKVATASELNNHISSSPLHMYGRDTYVWPESHWAFVAFHMYLRYMLLSEWSSFGADKSTNIIIGYGNMRCSLTTVIMWRSAQTNQSFIPLNFCTFLFCGLCPAFLGDNSLCINEVVLWGMFMVRTNVYWVHEHISCCGGNWRLTIDRQLIFTVTCYNCSFLQRAAATAACMYLIRNNTSVWINYEPLVINED